MHGRDAEEQQRECAQYLVAALRDAGDSQDWTPVEKSLRKLPLSVRERLGVVEGGSTLERILHTIEQPRALQAPVKLEPPSPASAVSASPPSTSTSPFMLVPMKKKHKKDNLLILQEDRFHRMTWIYRVILVKSYHQS